MKCPNCKEELNMVHTFSMAMQIADIDPEGCITSWGTVESIEGDTALIECPFCNEDIKKLITE